ncbi:MAG: hypothetical protein JO020_29385 [Chloroflexi bacterium]|nr:hypothetical protein [Chloroflexota bacterium]
MAVAPAGALALVGHAATSNPVMFAGLLVLAVGIGWARVHQRRHTVAQVAVGAATALPIALLTQ